MIRYRYPAFCAARWSSFALPLRALLSPIALYQCLYLRLSPSDCSSRVDTSVLLSCFRSRTSSPYPVPATVERDAMERKRVRERRASSGWDSLRRRLRFTLSGSRTKWPASCSSSFISTGSQDGRVCAASTGWRESGRKERRLLRRSELLLSLVLLARSVVLQEHESVRKVHTNSACTGNSPADHRDDRDHLPVRPLHPDPRPVRA